MESNSILYLYGNSYEIVLQNKQYQEIVETVLIFKKLEFNELLKNRST